MNFEQNNNLPEQQQTLPGILEKPAKKRNLWRIIWGIFTSLAIIGNVFLLLLLIAFIAFIAVGPRDVFTEEVIETGPRDSKIAVINLDGIIDSQKSSDLIKQIKSAAENHRVKGVIIRINSPGGAVFASDRIHNQILKYRDETGNPAVAFMSGLAASGGYYTSVACDKIIAEPTAITGSIGSIMGYFVIQDLLEEKLGIQPVIVKSGEKKDWPSAFRPPSEEQMQYVQDKLIAPAYQRFVELIADGREQLSIQQVRQLADGSIYSASEALDNKLIDQIGYLDDAVTLVKKLAGIEKAQVVEYVKPFSLSGLLSYKSQNLFRINRAKLYEFTTPQLLYLWSVY